MLFTSNFITVFSPLFFGIFFAVIFDPITTFFDKFICKRNSNYLFYRKISVVITLVFIFLVLTVIGFTIKRSFGGVEFSVIQLQITNYIEKAGDFLVLINIKLSEFGLLQNLENILSAWTDNLINYIENLFKELGSSLPNLGGIFLDVFLGFVISIYFLLEKKELFIFLNNVSITFLGEIKTDNLKNIFNTIHNIFIGYLGGQLIDASIMATLFTSSFYFLGLPYSIILGIFSGFSNIIPYFGSIVAFLLAVLSAVLMGDFTKGIYASIVILVLQQIDSLFIVPKVVGKKVEVHPVIVLLSLTVFGRLFGFIGLLLAVPLGALTKVLFFWVYNKVLEK